MPGGRRSNNYRFLGRSKLFSKHLPGLPALLTVQISTSLLFGIAAVMLLRYDVLATQLPYVVVAGSLVGILALALPAILTAITVRIARRRMNTRYTLFMALLSSGAYSVFLIIGSAALALGLSSVIADIIVLVGDASIFGWWFFIDRIMFGKRKSGVFVAVTQPTLNILALVPASGFLFAIHVPTTLLLVKLYAGIAVFLVVSYVIIYIFNKPMKSRMGFAAVDAFSQAVQSWLFNVDISSPFGPRFGTTADIDAKTLVLSGADNRIKSVFFVPSVHYGPFGTVGGSDFPRKLERTILDWYGATGFILHTTVNEDFNPVSSTQIAHLRNALRWCVDNARPVSGPYAYSESSHDGATVKRLGFGSVSLVTLTRAPRITEDVSPEAAPVLSGLLAHDGADAIIVDAHNSRQERASADELSGVTLGSKPLRDYVTAIKALDGRGRASRRLSFGCGSVDGYSRLDMPDDLAPGNINVGVFSMGRSRFALIQFNANNMMPSLRERILDHVKADYGIDAEVYTTDTHTVNSLGYDASNVLGRYTSHTKLVALVDEALRAAMADMGPVRVSFAKTTLPGFQIWGFKVRDKMFSAINTVILVSRVLVPVTIAAGFLAAAWVIYLI